MNKKCLMIFSRNPVPGRVKTRLAAAIGEDAAAAAYRFMLERCKDLTKGRNAHKQVWYTDHIEENDLWEERYFEKKLQQGADLGERMSYAFQMAFKEGFDKVVVIGTDIPDMSAKDIDGAFELLNDHDAVIGPAADGGYYLLGLNRSMPALFRNKQWGGSTVLADTLADLFSCRYALLEQKNDVDLVEDLENSPSMEWFVKKLRTRQL